MFHNGPDMEIYKLYGQQKIKKYFSTFKTTNSKYFLKIKKLGWEVQEK